MTLTILLYQKITPSSKEKFPDYLFIQYLLHVSYMQSTELGTSSDFFAF